MELGDKPISVKEYKKDDHRTCATFNGVYSFL